jgi:DNA polymerase III delta prime subunit
MSKDQTFKNLWVEAYRPSKLTEWIGDPAITKFLEEIKKKGEIPNLLLHGSAGLGKTSLAKIIAYDVLGLTRDDVLYINASEKSSIDVIRNEIMEFALTKSFSGSVKVIILDEVEGLSAVTTAAGKTSAQQALRNVMEEYAHNVRFILTSNYINKIIDPLRSRCIDLKFDRPPVAQITRRLIEIIVAEKITVPNDQKPLIQKLVETVYPDIRRAIQMLQKFSITGELQIDLDRLRARDLAFAADLLVKVRSGIDVEQLRKQWIDNEVQFNSNYHDLLRDVFQVVYESKNFNQQCKSQLLITIAEALYRHHTVMDQEINFFAAMLEVSQACQ